MYFNKKNDSITHKNNLLRYHQKFFSLSNKNIYKVHFFHIVIITILTLSLIPASYATSQDDLNNHGKKFHSCNQSMAVSDGPCFSSGELSVCKFHQLSDRPCESKSPWRLYKRAFAATGLLQSLRVPPLK